MNATAAAALHALLDERGETEAEFRRRFSEEWAALHAPIDVAGLERRGVLAETTGGWYLVLEPAAPPAHVRKQARAVAQVRIGPGRMVTLKFYRTRRG
jgi:hypothetical protein